MEVHRVSWEPKQFVLAHTRVDVEIDYLAEVGPPSGQSRKERLFFIRQKVTCSSLFFWNLHLATRILGDDNLFVSNSLAQDAGEQEDLAIHRGGRPRLLPGYRLSSFLAGMDNRSIPSDNPILLNQE